MLRLTNPQRRILSDSVARLATYGVAGLIVTHLVRPQRISVVATVVGLVVCACLFALAVMLVPADEAE